MTELAEPRQTNDVLRRLGPTDAATLVHLTRQDPRANLFVRARVEETGLRDALLGGSVVGVFRAGQLVAACHLGANVVPVQADDAALELFADHLLAVGSRGASVVGPQTAALRLWARLEGSWGPARSERVDQPFLALDRDPDLSGDPRVRRVMIDELDLLYPASVAMFREEVGVDPEVGAGHAYRARVSQLIARGWAFALVEHGEVVFKTEVAVSCEGVCQLQGVWVHPDHRGRGISPAALAQVVRLVRRDIAPDVTLYVNSFNTAARALYDRVGFTQVGTFASILL